MIFYTTKYEKKMRRMNSAQIDFILKNCSAIQLRILLSGVFKSLSFVIQPNL